jgi:hypothetical protein
MEGSWYRQAEISTYTIWQLSNLIHKSWNNPGINGMQPNPLQFFYISICTISNIRSSKSYTSSKLLQMTKLHTICRGACGTVWASETGPAYKREDGNPARSLQNDFEMHNQVLQSRIILMSLRKSTQVQIQIPSCHNFIEPGNKEWWATNLERFPQGHTPCNMIEAQRIPPFGEPTRHPSYSNILPG